MTTRTTMLCGRSTRAIGQAKGKLELDEIQDKLERSQQMLSKRRQAACTNLAHRISGQFAVTHKENDAPTGADPSSTELHRSKQKAIQKRGQRHEAQRAQGARSHAR